MKTFCRRTRCRLFSDLAVLCNVLSFPLFLFFSVISVLPGCLLASLLLWKSVLYPAAVPDLVWWLFAPLWVILSCAVPAVCASAQLASKQVPDRYRPCMRIVLCTAQLLLSFLWALLVLYRFPAFFCMTAAFFCAAAALLPVCSHMHFSMTLGCLQLISGLWNVYLVILGAGF